MDGDGHFCNQVVSLLVLRYCRWTPGLVLGLECLAALTIGIALLATDDRRPPRDNDNKRDVARGRHYFFLSLSHQSLAGGPTLPLIRRRSL